MKLYDNIIKQTLDALGTPDRVYAYDPACAWRDRGESELVMQRDAALELGGSGRKSVNFTCVTSTPELVTNDEIWLYGGEIAQLRGDVPFARIALLEVDDLGGDEEAYNAIRRMEFVRYHVFPEGYMVRVSSESNQEQVRLSKTAVRAGISFRSVGAAYIRKYRELAGVRHVRLIFCTGHPAMDAFIDAAKKTDAITQTLTHILDGLPTDCGHCTLKPVCDVVEGMRELHLGKNRKK